MKASDTSARKRILEAAEALIVESGLDAAGLPAVAARAGVDEDVVRRAFGSASELARAVFARSLDPLDAERLRLLSRAEALGVSVERVMRAYMLPWIRFWQTSKPLLILAARHAATPHRLLETEVAACFKAALARALPGMPPATLSWRLHFITGAILRLWADPDEATRRSGGLCGFNDIEAVVEQLVTFAAAALEPARYSDPHSLPPSSVEGPHGPSTGALS
jgi:AcrR family transcriptional regulator